MMCLALSIAGGVASSFCQRARPRQSPLHSSTHAVMFAAGGLELLDSKITTEDPLDVQAAPMLGWLSVFVLIFFDGITAYTGYSWLLDHSSTAVAIFNEYVKPLVGMIFNHLVAGETVVTTTIGICFSIILAP